MAVTVFVSNSIIQSLVRIKSFVKTTKENANILQDRKLPLPSLLWLPDKTLTPQGPLGNVFNESISP